jgi:23S rRNA pseudouridine2605 synthase
MEAAIVAGRVTVNGRIASLGERVSGADRIQLDGHPVTLSQRPGDLPRVLIYYKPTGEVSTLRDPEGRPTVFDRLPVVRNARWIQIGRLDYNTSGLLVFTTSGELANRLMHPSSGIEREYAVRVLGSLSHGQIATLRSGVTLEDGPAKFEIIDPQGGHGANRWYRVVIMEGRNREVRRLFEAVGLAVSRLIRTRFGPFTLPDTLHRGKSMELSPVVVRGLLRGLEPGGRV